MKLVLDTNIIFASLIRDSNTRLLLLHPSFDFYIPEFALEEIKKHKSTIALKTLLSDEKIDLLLEILLQRGSIVSRNDFGKYIDEADSIIGQVDRKDVPFLALALSFLNDGIWTQDKHFEKQSAVRVWKTEGLLNLLQQGKIR